jgi:pimeloyl-ACP methyl ester carboxylesterase
MALIMPARRAEGGRRGLLAHWPMIQPLLQAADLRGAAQLTTEAVLGLTHLVEAMHARIATLPVLGTPPPDERMQGVSGLVYKTVRGVTHVVGGSVEALLGWLGPTLAAGGAGALPQAEREAIVAALNGLVGDHLAATGNPLAIAMSFRHAGRPLALERFALRARLRDAGPRPLILLHGLCMNDLQWQREGHDHGAELAREAGFTPVYLHYNSGLSVSTNGRVMAQQMERLFDAWPVPIEGLTLLGHSMGGLVARSALHHSALIARGGLRWPARVTDLVCLGTPHQGAPLESVGHLVDVLLGTTPYAAPLARVGQVRSAGINDLRHGNIVSTRSEDSIIALPDGPRCYAVAADLSPAGGGTAGHLLGDGLVSVASALGQHRQPARRLRFPDAHQAVVHATNHLDLLSSGEVFALLRGWLTPQRG